MPQKKALIYARQSSGKEEESESIAMQISHCRELAQKNNIKVLEIFEDANSSGRLYPAGSESIAEQDSVFISWYKRQSAERQYRAGLGDLLNSLPLVDYVIVDDLTRIGRPLAGSFLQDFIMQRFMENNITIITVKNGVVDYNKFSDRLMSDLQSNINDNQILIQVQKSKDAMRKLKDSGYYPTEPKMFGIKYLGKKEVAVIPECAEVIRFIYEQILKFRSYNSIVAEVNEKYSHLFKKACYTSTFRHIASQPFYCGYMYNSEGILIPAKQMKGKEIISYDIWKSVQDLMNSRVKGVPRKQFRSLPFSQLLYCGKCGARLVTGFEAGKNFYFCVRGSQLLHDYDCSKSRLNINLVRKSAEFTGLKEAIAPLLMLPLFKQLEDQDVMRKKAKKINELERELQVYKDRLAKGLETFIAAGISAKELEKTAKKSKANILKLENEINEIKRVQESKREINAFYHKYEVEFEKLLDGTVEDEVYEMLLRMAIKRIDCFEDRLEIDTVYGRLTLYRYMVKKYRNFPKYTWKKIAENPAEKDLRKCKFEITYLYDNNKESRHIIDLAQMSIYEKR